MNIYSSELPKSLPGYLSVMTFIMYHVGYRNMDFDRLDQIADFCPGNTSTFTFKQYFECYLNNKFSPLEDKSEYELSKITCPVTLWYSDKDWAVTKSDSEQIEQQLTQSKVKNLIVPFKNFGHLDFLWDPRAHSGFYFDLLSDLTSGIGDDEIPQISENIAKFRLRSQGKQMLL